MSVLVGFEFFIQYVLEGALVEQPAALVFPAQIRAARLGIDRWNATSGGATNNCFNTCPTERT